MKRLATQLEYPFEIKKTEKGNFIAQAVDVPEALTQGSTLEEVLEFAEEALILGLSFYIENGEPIPMPSKAKKGQELVTVPIMAE